MEEQPKIYLKIFYCAIYNEASQIMDTFGGGGILQFSTVSSENDNNVFFNPNVGIFYRTKEQGHQEIPYKSFENFNFDTHPSYGSDVQEIFGVVGDGSLTP